MRAQFITASEVAEIMGISRSKAYQIVRRRGAAAPGGTAQQRDRPDAAGEVRDVRQILCLSADPWRTIPTRTQQLMTRMRDAQVLLFEPPAIPSTP